MQFSTKKLQPKAHRRGICYHGDAVLMWMCPVCVCFRFQGDDWVWTASRSPDGAATPLLYGRPLEGEEGSACSAGQSSAALRYQSCWKLRGQSEAQCQMASVIDGKCIQYISNAAYYYCSSCFMVWNTECLLRFLNYYHQWPKYQTKFLSGQRWSSLGFYHCTCLKFWQFLQLFSQLCLARGFICEFCREKDIIFPFQTEICRRCPGKHWEMLITLNRNEICRHKPHADWYYSGQYLRSLWRPKQSQKESEYWTWIHWTTQTQLQINANVALCLLDVWIGC